MKIRQPLNPYFVPNQFYFKEGEASVLVNGYRYQLEKPVQFSEEVPILDDLLAKRLFGQERAEKFKQGGYQEHMTVFTNQFGRFCVIADEKPAKIDIFGIEYAFNQEFGIVKRAFYLENANQLIPFKVFIPTYYNADDSNKLAVVLHGLGGNDVFDRSPQLAVLGEKYGYIVLAPNGYARGMHGSPYPMGRDLIPEDSDKDNLAGLDEEQKKVYPLCEEADMKAVRLVCDNYSVDKNNVFLFGNSMGGDGTFYLGLKYKEIFRALAPCGGFCDMRFYPGEKLEGKPVRMLIGTEDSCYNLMHEHYKILKDKNPNVKIVSVPGQPHSNAWLADLENIFCFFEEISNGGGESHE